MPHIVFRRTVNELALDEEEVVRATPHQDRPGAVPVEVPAALALAYDQAFASWAIAQVELQALYEAALADRAAADVGSSG